MSGPALTAIEDQLVTRTQAGDPEATGQLAVLVTPLVRRYAGRFFSDPGRAEDLAQTALMKAFARVRDVRSPEAFGAWLLRITRNECLNELARQRHGQIPLSTLEDQGASLEAPAGGEGDPEEQLIRGQLKALVRQVAASLPPHYRRTLTMRALEDRSYEEISVALDIPVTVARLWYCRARKRFRKAFVETLVARRGVSDRCFAMGVPIAEMIEGTLGRRDRDRVHEHLADCSVCRQTEDELRNTAFRPPARALLLGLGLWRGATALHRGVKTGLSQLQQAAGSAAVAGAAGIGVAASGGDAPLLVAPAPLQPAQTLTVVVASQPPAPPGLGSSMLTARAALVDGLSAPERSGRVPLPRVHPLIGATVLGPAGPIGPLDQPVGTLGQPLGTLGEPAGTVGQPAWTLDQSVGALAEAASLGGVATTLAQPAGVAATVTVPAAASGPSSGLVGGVLSPQPPVSVPPVTVQLPATPATPATGVRVLLPKVNSPIR
jgi:RNA polymerase sigma-70 factor (ECF subfamily)